MSIIDARDLETPPRSIEHRTETDIFNGPPGGRPTSDRVKSRRLTSNPGPRPRILSTPPGFSGRETAIPAGGNLRDRPGGPARGPRSRRNFARPETATPTGGCPGPPGGGDMVESRSVSSREIDHRLRAGFWAKCRPARCIRGRRAMRCRTRRAVSPPMCRSPDAHPGPQARALMGTKLQRPTRGVGLSDAMVVRTRIDSRRTIPRGRPVGCDGDSYSERSALGSPSHPTRRACGPADVFRRFTHSEPWPAAAGERLTIDM